MSIFDFFRNTESTPIELTPDQTRAQQLEDIDAALTRAGRLFDKTVVQLNAAKNVVNGALLDTQKIIEYHEEEIILEKQLKDKLTKRQDSVERVINNVKTMFSFDFSEDNE